MESDSLKWRKQFRIYGMIVAICILSWLFAVAFALLASSCTEPPAREPAPEVVRAPVLIRRMQMETEDIMSILESQPATALDNAKAAQNTRLMTKLKTNRNVKLKRRVGVDAQEPASPAICCDDFELTVSCADWTLQIAR